MTAPTVQRATGWIADASTFGARLALIRHRMGWNIKQAARECGQPAATWRLWEVDGTLPRRHLEVARAIAGATGCDFLWLVHGPDRGEGDGGVPTHRWPTARVVATVAAISASPTRAVTRTRPIVRKSTRPVTPIAA